MLTTLQTVRWLVFLLHQDSYVVTAGVCTLVGWFLGVTSIVCIFWRRLTRPGVEKRLRGQLADADAQVGNLLAQNDRLAVQNSELGQLIWDLKHAPARTIYAGATSFGDVAYPAPGSLRPSFTRPTSGRKGAA
jgi:hypothetical protein